MLERVLKGDKMEIIKTKKIPEINETYYQVVALKCDCCKEEIKEGEFYTDVAFSNIKYEIGHESKQFCKKCEKYSLYEIYINNCFFSPTRKVFEKSTKWWSMYMSYEDEHSYEIVGEENDT